MPPWLDTLGAWSWRLIVVGVVLLALVLVLERVRVIALPLVAAVLLVTILMPATDWLSERNWPRGLAALTVLVGGLAVVLGSLGFVVLRAWSQIDMLRESIRTGSADLESWLVDRGVPRDQLQSVVDEAFALADDGGGGRLLGGALLAVEVLAAIVLTLVLVFFLLKDGDGMWRWMSERFGGDGGDFDRAGERVWEVLGGYMRGTAVVGLFNAVLLSLVLLALGIPLVASLAVLTFFSAFFPLIGGIVAGAAAALVALADAGVVPALIVVAAAIAIQQIEGNVLQPLVVGRAVQLHAVAVLVAVTAGAALAGVIGAFLAVPLVASAVAVAESVRSSEEAGGEDGAAPSGT